MTEMLKEIFEAEGYTLFGMTPLARPLTIDLYKEWLQNNYHGEMSYLSTHLSIKENPSSHFPFAKSAFVLALNYLPHPKGHSKKSSLRIAQYAQGEDYHFWFKDKLRQTAKVLKGIFPDEEFLVATDSSPILERELARQAGIGWFGKNTCVIHPQKGSFFLLGEILTSLTFDLALKPIHDFCGNCTKCLDICPTDALIKPHVLDATKCISYLTIESRQVPPSDLRSKIGDWFFGCDLCQTVCPWNQKAFQKKLEIRKTIPLAETDRSQLLSELKFILTASGKKIEKEFLGTPLQRAGPFGLRRNALIVIGNLKLMELESLVEKYQKDPRLGELASWCFEQLKT